MKELREIDIDGAPLLFHAASSRGEHSCFRTAHDLITMVLGKGGLTEQVEFVDGLGRGLLMHAARSNHVETFKEVFDMCKEASGSLKLHENIGLATTQFSVDSRKTYCERLGRCLSSRRRTPSHGHPTTEGEEGNSGVRDLIGKPDCKGMTCLHHAAEAGCSAVLREVMKRYREAGINLPDEMGTADMNDRTPMMYVLRNDPCYGEENLKTKFSELYEHAIEAEEGWMAPRLVPSAPRSVPLQPSKPVPTKSVSKTSKVIKTRAVTELMHAARGGLNSLELALTHSPPALKMYHGRGFTVDLNKALDVKEVEVDKALGTKEIEDDKWQSNATTQTWGRALLLAAAAKLGNDDVLYHVLEAIEVSGQFVLLWDSFKYVHVVKRCLHIASKMLHTEMILVAHGIDLLGLGYEASFADPCCVARAHATGNLG